MSSIYGTSIYGGGCLGGQANLNEDDIICKTLEASTSITTPLINSTVTNGGTITGGTITGETINVTTANVGNENATQINCTNINCSSVGNFTNQINAQSISLSSAPLIAFSNVLSTTNINQPLNQEFGFDFIAANSGKLTNFVFQFLTNGATSADLLRVKVYQGSGLGGTVLYDSNSAGENQIYNTNSYVAICTFNTASHLAITSGQTYTISLRWVTGGSQNYIYGGTTSANLFNITYTPYCVMNLENAAILITPGNIYDSALTVSSLVATDSTHNLVTLPYSSSSGQANTIVQTDSGKQINIDKISVNTTGDQILLSNGGYKINASNPGATRTLSINDPLGNDSFVFSNATQTFTNKTLTAPKLSAGSFAYTISPSAPATNRIITMSDPLADDSLVYLNATQTLTNKTLSGISLSGVSLTLQTSGGTPATLNYYETGTFSTNWTGAYTVNQAVTFSFTRIGNMVTISCSNVPAAAASNFTTISTVDLMPTKIRPASAARNLSILMNNADNVGSGINYVPIIFDTSGSITIYSQVNGAGNFSASTAGYQIYPSNFTWTI